jgi:hypothetical protein
MTGSGTLPNTAGATPEQWQYGTDGAGTFPEYRNNREIRIPKISGGTYTEAGQFKSLARFKDGQIVTVSFRIRRGGVVGSPTGTFKLWIQPIEATSLVGLTGGTTLQTDSFNISSLSDTTYTLIRVTGTLDVQGGQGMWFFAVVNQSSDDDLYITEPMLNMGNDAAPFTTNTFLIDIAQFAYEGAYFVRDDFTNTNATLITAHYPSWSGAATSGEGSTWAQSNEAGATDIKILNSGTRAQLNYTAGAGSQITQASNNRTAETVAYSVQADVHGGTGTGGAAISSAGVVARWTSSANFYLAQVDQGGTVALFKCVAGVFTSLGTYALGVASATIKLQVTDAAKKVFVNGTERISSADNALTSAGKAGMRHVANYATTVTQQPYADNLQAFYVQNVAAPAAPASTPTPPPPIEYDPDTEIHSRYF